MDALQELIHKMEVGGGIRHLRKALIALVLLLLLGGYNWRGFKNMATQEAMDSAQVARNLAQGHGYTTLFIRPLSMFLVRQHNEAKGNSLDSAKSADIYQLKTPHPDLANPPVYPFLLAGLMKVVPFNYAASATKPFWSYNAGFWRFEPDFVISLFNQVIFLGVVWMVYVVARRLFGSSVAFLSALLTLGTELFWKFSVSGLSTIVLMLILMLLVWCLVVIEAESREPRGGPARLLGLAVLAGLLVGLGSLTRYSFAWLIIPVLAFLALFAGRQRVVALVLALVTFALLFTPWLARNYSVCGKFLGTAGYAVYEKSEAFPEYKLERSLQPELPRAPVSLMIHKLSTNLRQVVSSDLPQLGGTWLIALFLAGLLVAYHDPAVSRLRYFIIVSLVLMSFVQALVRTQLSEDSPQINSENLLVLFAPLLIIYGVSLFYLLLDQIEMPFRELRYAAITLFTLIACLPMILSFFPPRTTPISYPPYFPPVLQVAADLTKPDELTVSDLPWAMAWYGQRQSAWLNGTTDFLSINDYQKPIHELVLGAPTLDGRFSTMLLQPSDQNWILLALQCLPQIPRDQGAYPKRVELGLRVGEGAVSFPLHYLQQGWPAQVVLTARDHSPNASE